ncbi:MAG: preprotein translocase subunit TatC, partial [Deltaproteobacteria bacterium]|nr:preprotein translocase subunit TatC [Deltaproteobacteria bacterium]
MALRVDDDEREEREMSLIGHLSELRVRLMISVGALIVCVCLAFFVANPVLDVLTKPIRRLQRDPGREASLVIHVSPSGVLRLDKPTDFNKISQRRLDFVFDSDPKTSASAVKVPFGERPNQGVYFRKPLDPFMVPFRVSLVVGILLALPIILHQIWLFIMPGLRPAEKKLVRPMLASAIFLFPIGAYFGFLMVDMLMRTMQEYQPPSLEPLFDIDDYLSLLTNMMIVFGAIFE